MQREYGKKPFQNGFHEVAAWEKKVRGNIVPVKDLRYFFVVETVLNGHEIVVAEESICVLNVLSSRNNKSEMPGMFSSKNADKTERGRNVVSCRRERGEEEAAWMEEEARSIFCDSTMHLSVTAGGAAVR